MWPCEYVNFYSTIKKNSLKYLSRASCQPPPSSCLHAIHSSILSSFFPILPTSPSVCESGCQTPPGSETLSATSSLTFLLYLLLLTQCPFLCCLSFLPSLICFWFPTNLGCLSSSLPTHSLWPFLFYFLLSQLVFSHSPRFPYAVQICGLLTNPITQRC